MTAHKEPDPREGSRARVDQPPTTATADNLTVAGADIARDLGRRRVASYRLLTLDCGLRDPLDCRAKAGPRQITYADVTVSDLGLDCDHGPGCPRRGWAA